MKNFLILSSFLIIILSACQKENCFPPTTLPCHYDTTKQLVITGPRSEDTLHQNQVYETTWIGKIKNATEYRVTFKWIDYSNNLAHYRVLGNISPSQCSFKWKVATDILGVTTSNDCYLIFDAINVPGYIESARFSIKP